MSAQNIRTLTEDDLEQLFAVHSIAFSESEDLSHPPTLQRYRDHLPYTRGYFVGDTLSSVYTMFPFEMYVAGRRVKIGGLAGVASAPEYRRRGHIVKLLKDGLERLKEAGVGWCLEYPFDPRFYARYGWQSVKSGTLLEVPSDKLFRGRAPDAVRLNRGEVAQLKPIYETWAQGYHFTISRDNGARPSWERLIRNPWETHDRLIYKLEDAYCLLKISYNETMHLTEMNVHDYAFSSPTGRSNLFGFIGSFHGQADVIRLHLPGDEPYLLDLQSYLSKDIDSLQARIVDVKVALESLSSPVESSFSMRVKDDFCEWNNQTFQVTLGEKNEVTVADSSPDLTLDIRALALLLSGGLTAEAAMRAGLVEGEIEVVKALTSLASEQTSFMPLSDYF